MRNFYIILGAVAVVGLGVVGFSVFGGSPADELVDLGDVDNQTLVQMAQGIVRGDPDAPVTIMEFGDYQCPACAQFARMIKPQVDLAYIETGQAKFVFHDFPLPGHPHAFLAARAARCAGDQDRYWDYHDQIFITQNQWSVMRSATGHFKDLADEIGLDTRAFGSCLDSDMHADLVSANSELGRLLGVGGTPTVFVHSGQEGAPAQRLGGFQFIDVQQAMDAILEN